MKYYPVNLDIRNRKCLVVGGGTVGTRKVMTLLNCGAKVTVVSSDVAEKLQELSDGDIIKLEKRPFQISDLDEMFLVMGATDNQEINREIHSEAERLGVLCNIADRPEVCNFILPAIVNRGDLIIAISTSGKSPAFAKKIRKDLEKVFGTEYAEFLKLMGEIRNKLLSEDHEPEAHKHLFEKLIKRDLIKMIKDRNIAAVNSLLFEILGEGYIFDELMAK
ncbi:MAG: bifunctional precorrin-2 dehydrogenase/sirohydrochlorin ferrochelatase [Deltaproteobacteria bacterium]|nr:bifunctional precorrin-2 dehydrogenase/sirohydrochlorin ferrochelatase [Deltaproteobacteria bacterium]